MATQTNQGQDRIETMAIEFSAKLKRWLSREQIKKVVSRNRDEDEPNICHSHDFCDANMALHDVFMKHGMDVTAEGGVSRHCQEWHDVWQLAKQKQFWFRPR
ncbi:hypothetical protein [Accumulibacter sp.]|uniref:hypothetical protein n=1 Tax=Accumulibacter sp. TaxID=2053492 RepID=UPI0028C49142|nr:hypothetical protein [Accumulibacter sp.]